MGGRPYVCGGTSIHGELLQSVEYYDQSEWIEAKFQLPTGIRNAGAVAIGPSRFLIFGGSARPAVNCETQYTCWSIDIASGQSIVACELSFTGSFSPYQFTERGREAAIFSEEG
jgi:hypothetical protein